MKPTVLLGITGCIGAYKSCELVRMFQKLGFRVKVVMTEHATEFIGPTTFRALTNEPVAVSLFTEPEAPIYHISLAKEADVFLIAPCTANVIGKLAHGVADDLLTTTALACEAPIVISPAMNTAMYEDDAFQENLAALRERGITIIEADEGYLACGDVGKGRMPELDIIVAKTIEALGYTQDLAGKHVLITAGPTREEIDPVRFISNYSSGKMGYAIARAALLRGAKVTLVSGPVALDAPDGAELVSVTSAREMDEAVRAVEDFDIAICSAAVADYRPETRSDVKLKKGHDDEALQTIHLVKNPDILAGLGERKRPGQIVVGFAADTDDLVEYAQQKLTEKQADLIIANSVANGQVFGADTNKAYFVCDEGVEELEEKSKEALAHDILYAALHLARKEG